MKARDPIKNLEHQRRYRAKQDPKELAQRQRESNLNRLYGITQEEYDARLAAQGGGCAVCGKKPKPDGPSLHVDHSHVTGNCRGILCWRCNRTIGREEDGEFFIRVGEYLKAPPWTTGTAVKGPAWKRKRRYAKKKRK